VNSWPEPLYQTATNLRVNDCEFCGTPLVQFIDQWHSKKPFCLWCAGGYLLAGKCRDITQAGTLCRQKASDSVTGMCGRHSRVVRSAISEQLDRYRVELRKEKIHAQQIDRRSWIVYYFQRANGDIKIGYSSKLQKRKYTLEREHGPLELLATHSGGPDAEAAMHVKFADERIDPRREWFAPSRRLMDHIEAINRRHAVAS
jgi:hypothetical protein